MRHTAVADKGDQHSAGRGLTFMLVAHDNCCRLAPVDGADVSAGCIQMGHENLWADIRQLGTGSLGSASRNTLRSPTALRPAKRLPEVLRTLQQQSSCTLAQSWCLRLRKTQAGHMVCAAPDGYQTYDKAIRHTTRQPGFHLLADTGKARGDCAAAPQASPGSLHS